MISSKRRGNFGHDTSSFVFLFRILKWTVTFGFTCEHLSFRSLHCVAHQEGNISVCSSTDPGGQHCYLGSKSQTQFNNWPMFHQVATVARESVNQNNNREWQGPFKGTIPSQNIGTRHWRGPSWEARLNPVTQLPSWLKITQGTSIEGQQVFATHSGWRLSTVPQSPIMEEVSILDSVVLVESRTRNKVKVNWLMIADGVNSIQYFAPRCLRLDWFGHWWGVKDALVLPRFGWAGH